MSVPTYSVSGITRALGDLLYERFPLVRVTGEVGRFTAHRSGHWYFSLKDEHAVLDAAMFRGANRSQRWQPRVGERVIATGELSIYAPRGSYSLVVRQLQRAGAGDLQARLEALKRKLAAEGLFDPSRKRPLPALPRALGVVTSPTGAALRDILRVVDLRFPGFPVLLAPCLVQGVGAAREIAAALGLLDRQGQADLIIVGRGGGSAEDLQAFNEEETVRAVAACGLPVICAVGHETDVSLCDLAADLRAATPSHAAELAVPERATLQARVQELQQRLQQSLRRQIGEKRTRLLALRLRHPRRRLQEARMRCDELDSRLRAAALRQLSLRRSRLENGRGRLGALSPLAVLERGYAIALHEGKALRDPSELQRGQRLQLRLSRGGLEATVERLLPTG